MKFRIATQQKQMTITSENEINLAANLEISFAAAKTTENGKEREREINYIGIENASNSLENISFSCSFFNYILCLSIKFNFGRHLFPKSISPQFRDEKAKDENSETWDFADENRRCCHTNGEKLTD